MIIKQQKQIEILDISTFINVQSSNCINSNLLIFLNHKTMSVIGNFNNCKKFILFNLLKIYFNILFYF